MENHQHRSLLNNSVKNSDVKKQKQQSVWGSATANSLSNKLLNRSSGSSSSSSSRGNENRCSFGASLAAAAVGVHNPAPLVSRCSVECEEVEKEEEEEEEQEEEKEKKEREVVVEEQGSSGLRSAWIRRIIPRVVGEEKEKERGLRECAEQDSLVGFWKKKTASCVVADVDSARVVAQRAREPNSSNERALDKQKEVQGGSGDGGDGVCSSSYLLGSRDELQRLGYQSWEDSAAAPAAAGGNRLLLRPEVISSAAHVRSNAGGGGVAAGLGLQFDGGGGGAARNFWVANNNNNNNNRSSSSNSSKERDMQNSSRFSTLPPLSPFVPFKHSKELHQSKSMDYQVNNSSSSGKLEEVAVAPLLTPWLLFPSYGVEQINAQQGKMAETVTGRMDNVPSLTPLYVPSKSSSLDSINISRLREKGLLGLGEMLSRPTDLTQVFSPFKSPQDANDESPCSSKTASLPLELVLTMDPPNSNDSLKHEEDTGPKSRVQPEIDFEKCQQQAGSSANLCIAMPSRSSLWPGYENKSGSQEPSCHSRGDVKIFRQGSSSGQRLVDHEYQEIQHSKVQKVVVEDRGALGLLSDPPVSCVGGTPGCQSPLFQSTSSCTPLNAVGERNTAVQGGCHNSAMQALQQDSSERRRGLSRMKESNGQELGPEDRDRGRGHTRDDERKREGRERRRASEQLEGVARKDIDTEKVSSGSGAMEGWCGSSHGIHALGQGSRQGGDVWQRHNDHNLLIDALGDRSGGTSSWKSICDPLMDSPSHVSEEVNPTCTQAGHVSSAEELPKARKVQTWLQRWMRPLTPGSNNSKCPQPLSISMVSSGSGLGTANQVVSDAYTSTGTESEEVVWCSRRVEITVSDETGLELERKRSHSVMDLNQFARTQRGNVFVGEDEGSRLKKSFLLGYNNHPSAAAMALVGAASRRSMPIPPQRPVKRVALMAGTANSPPGAGPPGSSPGLGGIHP